MLTPVVQTLFDDDSRLKPLKVLFFYQDFGAMGGIERYLLDVSQRLQAQRTVHPVVVCSSGTPLYTALKHVGIEVHGIQSASFFSRSVLRMFDFNGLHQLRRIIQRVQPDVLHVQIGLLENIWLKSLGIPVVYTVHGYSTLYSLESETSPPSALKRLIKRGIRELFQITASQMDSLLFVSQAEQDRMLAEGFIRPDKKGSVLYNGLDTQQWLKQAKAIDIAHVKAALGLPETSRVVSFINRLDANKNPLHFIELAKALLAEPEFQDVHFLIAGDGLLAGFIRLQTLSEPQIHVLGHCQNVCEIMAVSDLLVYTSLREGFGLGLVEGMAVNRLCLSYAHGAALEILNEPELKACIVPVNQLDSLIGHAKSLLSLSDESRTVLLQNLQQRAQNFDIQQTIAGLNQTYNMLKPLVSVILPVYQGEASVLRAVRSVLSQTYAHWELIIVDDGSTDNTLQQLSLVSDARVRVFSRLNEGVAKSRNFAFTQASGDYIAFIDADDIWLPEKLMIEIQRAIQHQSSQPEKPGCIIYSGYYAVNESLGLLNLPVIRQIEGDLSVQVLEDEGLFLPSTAMVHRSVFEAVGGFKSDCYHEDRVFFIQACQQFLVYSTGQRLVLYQQSVAGRCRRILQDFDQALNAEVSIVATLRETFPQDTLDRLKGLQLRNLLFRFLMYGFLPSARQIAIMLKDLTLESSELFLGKKGLLARFSLASGVNLLMLLRLFIQQGIYPLLTPFWWFFLFRCGYFSFFNTRKPDLPLLVES